VPLSRRQLLTGAAAWLAGASLPAGASSSTVSAFRAVKSIDQHWVPHNRYTHVPFDKVIFDRGGHFDRTWGVWWPPAGLVTIIGQIWISAGAAVAGSPSFVAKVVYNNEVDVAAGIGAVGSIPGTATIPFAFVDETDGRKGYWLELYASTPSFCRIDSHPAHTWFSGMVVP